MEKDPMNWTALLNAEVEHTYATTTRLYDQIGDADLGWRPGEGENWMTTGALLRHIGDACGIWMHAFVTGEFPEMPGEEMPTADTMPVCETLDQARTMLDADWAKANTAVSAAGEERLSSEMCTAPWDPSEMILGQRLLQMVNHLNQHKGQLFYYLKLQGKPVNTAHLWGM